MSPYHIDTDTSSAATDSFSHVYPAINRLLANSGETVQSRNGLTKEILNFKTVIRNPYFRCSGGYGRDMNIFFMMAEAMWIWCGRKDVKFLAEFNSRMGDYSDDGQSFHAPYGFRLRNYGLKSADGVATPGYFQHMEAKGTDQLIQAAKMLAEDPLDRRVVLSIWNPELDLATKSKDLPCNDLVMFKIRDGELHTTIANRSNDLHWGLPTNVYQFSFLSEVLSEVLGVTLGTQTHNSQSLHYYLDNPIADQMLIIERAEAGQVMSELYNSYNHDTRDRTWVKPLKLGIAFRKEGIEERMAECDLLFNGIVTFLQTGFYRYDVADKEFSSYTAHITEQSQAVGLMFSMLCIYKQYKFDMNTGLQTKDECRQTALESLYQLYVQCASKPYDILVMGMNFFIKRLEYTGYADQYRAKCELPFLGKY